MNTVVIKPGEILVKRDGIIYELDHETFNKIRAIIFDTDSHLCLYCKKGLCSFERQIDDENITDGLTMKSKDNCEYVLGCTDVKPWEKVTGPMFFYPEGELTETERIIRHYGDAFRVSIADPRAKRYFRKNG